MDMKQSNRLFKLHLREGEMLASADMKRKPFSILTHNIINQHQLGQSNEVDCLTSLTK